MKLYQVQGTITRTETDPDAQRWASTRQIPTFYLNSDVQGILSADHARRVALDVVDTIAGPVSLGHAWSCDLVVTEYSPNAETGYEIWSGTTHDDYFVEGITRGSREFADSVAAKMDCRVSQVPIVTEGLFSPEEAARAIKEFDS